MSLDDPQSADERVRRLEGLLTEARYHATEAGRVEQEWRDTTRLGMRCPYCQAHPGEWCMVAQGYTTAGRRAAYLHEARGRVLRTAAQYANDTARAYAAVAEHHRQLAAARRTQ